ncbi:MAG: hypothetical protein NTV54_17045 [Ignavibacteriales bacterium]|nr:hypothetical protein [Ignavibacteriales bacterium]
MKYFLLSIAVVFSVVVGNAQKRSQQKEERPAFERVESFKKVRLLETLKLDEATSVKFIARYNQHIERMRAADRARGELVDKLEQQMAADASDAEFAQSFAILADYEKKMLDGRIGFISELREILTARQVAQFIIFERTFNKDLRNIIRDIQKNKEH